MKNDELSSAYKDKHRKLVQTQELYDRLKRKAMVGHIQDAASDAVDTTLHGSTALGPQPAGRVENPVSYEQRFDIPYSAAPYAGRFNQSGRVPAQPRMPQADNQNATWERSAPPQNTCL